MKTIKIMDVKQVPLENLQPGMIVHEGVVLGIDHGLPGYHTVAGPFYVEPGDDGRYRVTVLGKIESAMLDHLLDVTQHGSARKSTMARLPSLRQGEVLTIEVDTVLYDQDGVTTQRKADTLFTTKLKPLGVISCQVVNEHGPAGGNPILALTGTRDALRRVLKEVYLIEDDEEADELYGV